MFRGRRFARMKWIRMMNELLSECDWFDPGDPYVDDYWLTRTDAQNRRQENRHADFEWIADKALELRSGLSTLRR